MGAQVSTVAGGEGSYGSADGIRSAARFDQPYGVTTDGANLYVADGGNHAIRRIGISSGTVTTLAGLAGSSGAADGYGSAARFNAPRRRRHDGRDEHLRGGHDSHTIRKVVIGTGEATTGRDRGVEGSATARGPRRGSASRTGVTTDGRTYTWRTPATTRPEDRDLHGRETTLAGTAGSFAPPTARGRGEFDELQGITTVGTNLYVADTYNSTIRKVVIARPR